MDRSNVAEASVSIESADEACVPLNNSPKNITTNSTEFDKAEDHWKYLLFDAKEDRSLQTMEHENSSEPSEGPASSNGSRSTVITELKAACETSNMSKTNLSPDRSTSGKGEISLDNNLNVTAGGSQQTNKTDRRRKSVVFTSKRKSNSRGPDDEEFDDSGVVLNNSNEITSPVESDSAFGNKMSTSSKNNSLSWNLNTSDEDEVWMDDNTKNETVAAEDAQATKVGRRRKLFPLKRKLSFEETEDLEYNESSQTANKRGRGKYKLRDLSNDNLTDNINKTEPKGKRAKNKSTKHNSSQADEYETETSAIEETTDNYEIQKKDKLLSKSQAAHNNQILKLINEGSPAKLRTLSRVGMKTAMMIHQYRQLNGKLDSIRDLENMSGWSPKIFELFLSANNIVLD